jgi:hypothetical protein
VNNLETSITNYSFSCQYDSLEISEFRDLNDGKDSNTDRQGSKVKKFCGDWTRKLKLLRYTSSASRTPTTLFLKFESDFSHHFAGFKANILVEKGEQKTLCNIFFTPAF